MGFVERINGTKSARERGRQDFHAGIPYSENPYRHFMVGEGNLVLMNQWEEGWLLGERERASEELSARRA